jgi:hypothetical protein
VVRALGAHRYVAGSMHSTHAFAVDAAARDPRFDHPEAAAWAREVLADAGVDKNSRDERLVRPLTTPVLSDLLRCYWVEPRAEVHDALREHLEHVDVTPEGGTPFDDGDENAGDDVFPLLVDAGWELLRFSELDVERHAGVIQSFEDPILFASAVFEESSALEEVHYLYELPSIGARELLVDRAACDLGLWIDAPEPYIDYVLRGVLRAAK